MTLKQWIRNLLPSSTQAHIQDRNRVLNAAEVVASLLGHEVIRGNFTLYVNPNAYKFVAKFFSKYDIEIVCAEVSYPYVLVMKHEGKVALSVDGWGELSVTSPKLTPMDL